MRQQIPASFKKLKKRRILVLAAGSAEGGIQCLYLSVSNGSWEILSTSNIPYPQKIISLLQLNVSSSSHVLMADELGQLDYRLSLFFTEAAKTALAALPTAQKTPHLGVLVKPNLWKGQTLGDGQQQYWDLTIGDAQHLASSLQIPVVTDLIRHSCIAGNPGLLPLHFGNLQIAGSIGGMVTLLNLGLIARMTVIDTKNLLILTDTDTGPGTCLINAVMRQAASENPEGFDRDGSIAKEGVVHGECLKRLCSEPWFNLSAPKNTTGTQFTPLLDDAELTALPLPDKLATITALTARSVYDCYRKVNPLQEARQTILLSGGGANNQTLLAYLKTYFDAIPIKNVEEIGIPVDMRIPVALGLSIDALACGHTIHWTSGNAPTVTPGGKWIWP